MRRKHLRAESHSSVLWVLSDRRSGDWKEPYPLEPFSIRQDNIQLVSCNQEPEDKKEGTVIGGSGLLGVL